MKKIYFLLAVVLLTTTSCTEEEPLKKTTVKVTNNLTYYSSTIEGLNATIYNATLLLYKGSDMVGQLNLGDIVYSGGVSQTVEIADYIEKSKLMFKILPANTTLTNYFKYTAQYYVIIPNTDNHIIITNETLVTDSPTKGGSCFKLFK